MNNIVDKIFLFISMCMLVFFVLMAFNSLNIIYDGAYEIGIALIIAIQITHLFVVESEVDKLKKKMKSD